MGEQFDQNVKRTNGISVHRIKTSLNKNLRETGSWSTTTHGAKDLMEELSRIVFERVEDKHSQKTAEATTSHEEQQAPTKKRRGSEHSEIKRSRQGSVSEEISQESSEKWTKDVAVIDENISMDQATEEQIRQFQNSALKEKPELTITIWDLGGQDDFIATHHLFLDVKPTNVIFIDMSKNLDERLRANAKPGHPDTPAKFLHYWLRFIDDEAKSKHIKPSVALVLSHFDVIRENKEEEKEKYITEVLKEIEEKPYSQLISRNKIYVVSNKEGTDKDFEDLRNELVQSMSQQESFDYPMPAKWLKLEADMINRINAEQNQKHCIWYSEIKQLAVKNAMADDSTLKAFLESHNTLGTFLYYPDVKIKSPSNSEDSLVITDPQWLPDMIATLITAEEFLKEKYEDKGLKQIADNLKSGRVTRENLRNIWENEAEIEMMIQVMKKFNLMMPETSEQYVIPCMLPYDKPTVEASGGGNKSLEPPLQPQKFPALMALYGNEPDIEMKEIEYNCMKIAFPENDTILNIMYNEQDDMAPIENRFEDRVPLALTDATVRSMEEKAHVQGRSKNDVVNVVHIAVS